MTAAPSLRTFLRDAEERLGDAVLEIGRPVRSVHELSAVVKALETRGNPIVRFAQVDQSQLPVICGVTATPQRIAAALSTPVAACADRVLACIAAPLPPSPVAPGSAPVQEIVATGADASLDSLPIGVHSPEDAGRYITSGVMLLRDPATGKTNAGIYRTMVKDSSRITINSAPQHDAARILGEASQRGETVDFAIVIGGHPALAIASQAKNPPEVDALGLAGALLDEPLGVTPGVTVDLAVPAHAEIVIEGRVRPAAREAEGPFGEFTYYYGAAEGWVGEITAITRREDAIYVDLHPAHVEHRCLWLFPGREARLLSMLRAAVPGVRSAHLPLYGAALSAYVSLEKHQEGDAQRALLIALSWDTYVKHAFVFDPDVDIHDPAHVLWALNVRFQADRDLVTVPRSRSVRMDPSGYDYLDRGAPGVLSTKCGFDVTMPLARPYGPRADVPPPGFEGLDVDEYLPKDPR